MWDIIIIQALDRERAPPDDCSRSEEGNTQKERNSIWETKW